jgi:hypothetical protein
VAEKKQFTKIAKPADFEPDTHFPSDWPVRGHGGKPRCPGWSRSAGAQCGRIAGYGTPRKGEVGACCKSHGGSSKGAPKGNTNAVNPDGAYSEYVKIEDIKELDQFNGMSDVDMADILVKLAMAKTIKIASVTQQDEASKLLAVMSSANSALRTKASIALAHLKIAEMRERQGKASDEDSNKSEKRRAKEALSDVMKSFGIKE